MMITRLNRYALDVLIERSDFTSRSEFARAVNISRGHLTDLLSGRRDAPDELSQRMADALDVEVRAIRTDPDGQVAPLVKLYNALEKVNRSGDIAEAFAEARKAKSQ